ncbi:hypothetical protein NQ315_014581 [Exocentrus adspersus]|uniref:Zinc finger PHD-type domain-containing protein n=1 Tax=Exocentrus adspersus TaxID=1586481 RepID=A0AAV8VDU1_9CUCU|nr:hypothetical protein NQ315_014581 [Exocentrus adspersus]
MCIVFQKNEQKSKIWQDAMGIKYIPGVSLKNYSICCRHFTVCRYLNRVTGKLCANAVPTLLSASSVGQQSPSEQTCTAGDPEYSTSIFRGIKGLSAADTTPRKQHLMNLVKSKEAHIRKLKKLCRKKTGDIKSLTNIGDSTVVRNVFRGMSSGMHLNFAAVAILAPSAAAAYASGPARYCELFFNIELGVSTLVSAPAIKDELPVCVSPKPTESISIAAPEESISTIINQDPEFSPFKKHLQYPCPIEKSSKQAWRTHYIKQSVEKEEKENAKKRRREQIQKKREEKEIKRKYVKRKKILKSANNESNQVKQKCGTCKEELFSDAEDDQEKNVGCDFCPLWFHLRCTRFLGRSYDEVAQETNFQCDICNK